MIDALQRLYDRGGGTLYFPGGRYQLSTPIRIAQGPGVPLAIRGDGPALSTITWTCPDGGFAITSTAEGNFDGKTGAIIVEGLSLLTDHIDGGTGLAIINTNRNTSPAPKKLIRDIVFAGSLPPQGWGCGVRATDCSFITLSGIDYQGHGIAVKFDGQHDPVDIYVQNLRVLGAFTGIDISGNCEGIYVSQSTLLFVERGIHWHTMGPEPFLTVTGSHISASRDCIYATNLLQPIITGNLLYQHGEGNWTGIWLSGDRSTPFDLIQIAQNIIHGFSGGPKNGIVVTNRTGGVIQGNVIHNVDTGIWLQIGTSEVRVVDNYIHEVAAGDFNDEGCGNVIRKV